VQKYKKNRKCRICAEKFYRKCCILQINTNCLCTNKTAQYFLLANVIYVTSVTMSEKGQGYLDFDEYIVASEPHRRERAEAWKVAIGLQAVDGLHVSEYLKQTARRHIEGEITIDDARELVRIGA
jgi:hypothetical protein